MASNKRTIASVVEREAAAAGMTPLEWLCAELESGVSFFRLAARLDVSRQSLSSYAHKLPDAKAAIATARQEGAHAIYEKGTAYLEDCDETPAAVQKARAIVDNAQWAAAHFHRMQFGDAPAQVNVQINSSGQFLDAMRVRRMPDSARARLIEPAGDAGSDIADAIVIDDVDVSDDNATG